MAKKQSYQTYLSPVLIVVFLLVGIVLGVLYQNKKEGNKLQQPAAVIKILNSDVVPSIVSYGKVTNIDGRKITMAFNEDLITIKVRDDASIYNIASQAGQSKMDFSQIKVGDMLNVKIDIDSDGNFEGYSIINFSNK